MSVHANKPLDWVISDWLLASCFYIVQIEFRRLVVTLWSSAPREINYLTKATEI